MECVDCRAPSGANRRCAECQVEIDESPAWRCRACDVGLVVQAFGNPPKWCSGSCRQWAYYNPGKQRAADWRDYVPGCHKVRLCAFVECGGEFTNVNLAQRYCSISCGQKARYPKTVCSQSNCVKIARSRGMCSTHYNISQGTYIGTVRKDPDRERARLRIKTHRRRDWSRMTDITPEIEMAMRARAKRCPICRVGLIDVPYQPRSKELDHIIPKGVNGTHTVGNVRIICRQCNLTRPKDGSDYTGPVTLWALEVK